MKMKYLKYGAVMLPLFLTTFSGNPLIIFGGLLITWVAIMLVSEGDDKPND
jgi:hypothetical protein